MYVLKSLTSRFIGGYNNSELIKTVKHIKTTKSWNSIIDYAKEGSLCENDVTQYTSILRKTIDAVQSNLEFSVSYAFKLSSFQPALHKDDMSKLVSVLAANNTPSFLDAESQKTKATEDAVFSKLLHLYNKDKTILYKTYQMYRKDSMKELKDDIRSYENHGIKLVRGAYMNQDKNSGVLYTNKVDTDKNYDEAVEYVLSEIKVRNGLKVVIATHNVLSVEKALYYKPDTTNVSFAQLLGMKDCLSDHIVSQGYTVHKYVPYGSFKDTLPYLTRRLYENYDILGHLTFKI